MLIGLVVIGDEASFGGGGWANANAPVVLQLTVAAAILARLLVARSPLQLALSVVLTGSAVPSS